MAPPDFKHQLCRIGAQYRRVYRAGAIQSRAPLRSRRVCSLRMAVAVMESFTKPAIAWIKHDKRRKQVVAWTLMYALMWVSATVGQEPCRGVLVLAGGGALTEIYPRFRELIPNDQACLVVIPTALTDEELAAPGIETRMTAAWQARGFDKVVVLHTRDRDRANASDFVEPLAQAHAVWFTGGRQWRLADSYLGTKTEKALHELFLRGGIVGGTSAGATIQGSFLIRGDTRNNSILIGDHTRGFGFLPNMVIDQHWQNRRREADLEVVRREHPELLGIGIDEETALIVRQVDCEVIGRGVVGIYEPGARELQTTPATAYRRYAAGEHFRLPIPFQAESVETSR